MSIDLYDWQIPHVGKLVRSINKYGVAKDGSDTGTGKTVMALYAAKQCGLIPFVICPKAVIPSWEAWMQEIFGHVKVDMVHNYERLKTGKTKFVKRKGKSYDWQLNRDKIVIVFDEDHRCKGDKSQNAKLMYSAKKQGYKLLLLGATSFSSPIEMKALGYALGLHDWSGWWKWCLQNNCVHGDWGGLVYRPSPEHLEYLHEQVYEKGSRVRVKDLPDGAFPDNLIEANTYALNSPHDADWINAVYEEMNNELAVLREREKMDADPHLPLTVMLRARQKVELLKVPIFVELIRDHIQDGKSVALFLNYKETLHAIAERIEDIPKSYIHGEQKDSERISEIDDFQRDKTHVILCTLSAGGVGINLHDTNGTRPRVSLISPSFSAIDLKQALGRIHRAGGKSPALQYIIFAKDTIEAKVCRKVKRKLTNIDMINDNDVSLVDFNSNPKK